MREITKISLLILFLSLKTHAQDDNTDLINYLNYIPESSCGEIIHYTSYSVSFCEETKISEWAIYYMTSDKIGTVKRTNNFRQDPKVNGRDATLKDYRGSGYDRGHLVPARDMSLNKIRMSESFFMTNITPQEPSFNQIIFRKLENKVRDWIYKYDSLIIITGCIDTSFHIKTIGKGQVRIPDLYYKIIIDIQNLTSISFLIPNKRAEKKLLEYETSIENIEKISGIDFFYKLPDHIEKLIESSSLTPNNNSR